MKSTTIMTLPLLCVAGCAAVRPGQSFQDLRYPVPVSYLDVDGIKVAYSDSGPPPGSGGAATESLLLIHGLGSYLPVWNKNIPALSPRRRVVALDLPGYGKSSKANYQYSMGFFADVVDRVITQLQLEPVVLVGHSMGGQIALTHALRHRGRARALVLVAPAGLETFEAGEGQWLTEVTSKEFVTSTPPEGVYANLANNFADMPRDAHFMVEDRLRVIGGPDFDAYAYAVSRSVAAMIEGPVFDQLPEIDVPVLVIFGADDGLIPNPFLHGGSTEVVARRGVERLKHGRLLLVPRAGHMVQFEKPEVVNQAIQAFLAGLPRQVGAADPDKER